jgi:hypothetical protein
VAGGARGGSSPYSIAFSNIRCNSQGGSVTVDRVTPLGGRPSLPRTVVSCRPF